MSTRRERRLERLMQAHALVVREFVGRAAALDARRWRTPRGEGKWTPAQETQHILLTYLEFLRQLRERTPMRRRGNAPRRLLSRAIGLTSILWFKRIPVAVRAPREVRPEEVNTAAPELLATLTQRVGEFEAAFATAWRTEHGRRLSHHLFGTLTLDQGLRLVTVHTRHHAAFLPAITLPPSSQ